MAKPITSPLPTFYLRVGLTAFRQQFAYRASTFAGLFTYAIFGSLYSAMFLALYHRNPHDVTGGFTQESSVTYAWLNQAILVPLALLGWWDVARSIVSGAFVTDFIKPANYLGYWWSRDVGRASAQILIRTLPTLLIGDILFGLLPPGSIASACPFTGSLCLAIVISFGVRFMLNLVAFWLLDYRAVAGTSMYVIAILAGHMFPLTWYPGWAQAVLSVLPFRAMIMIPVEVWLGQVNLVWGLTVQAFWAVFTLALAHVLLRFAQRKVVVQGG